MARKQSECWEECIQSQRRRGHKPSSPAPRYAYICRPHVQININPFCIRRLEYICTLGTMAWALSRWAGASMYITALRPRQRDPRRPPIPCSAPKASSARSHTSTSVPRDTVQHHTRLAHRIATHRNSTSDRRRGAAPVRHNSQTNSSQGEPFSGKNTIKPRI